MIQQENPPYVSEIINYSDLGFYSGIELQVFAPEWYYSGKRSSEYSKIVLESKTKDCSDKLIPFVKRTIDELKKQHKIWSIDLIAIVPKHDSTYSPTLNSLGKVIANYLSSKYDNIIRKKASGDRRNAGSQDLQSRYDKTKGSLELTRNLNLTEKNILIIDDLKVTGLTLLETAHNLIKSGASHIFCICLGINKHIDAPQTKSKNRCTTTP